MLMPRPPGAGCNIALASAEIEIKASLRAAIAENSVKRAAGGTPVVPALFLFRPR